MPKTQNELNEKIKGILVQFEDWELWEAEYVLKSAYDAFRNNAVVKQSQLADLYFPSNVDTEEQPRK